MSDELISDITEPQWTPEMLFAMEQMTQTREEKTAFCKVQLITDFNQRDNDVKISRLVSIDILHLLPTIDGEYRYTIVMRNRREALRCAEEIREILMQCDCRFKWRNRSALGDMTVTNAAGSKIGLNVIYAKPENRFPGVCAKTVVIGNLEEDHNSEGYDMQTGARIVWFAETDEMKARREENKMAPEEYCRS